MKKLGAILLTLALVVGLSIPMAMPAAASPSPGLVGLWHFDGDANDSSGNGNHGTIYGANYVSGNFDQALSFDGSGDYVDCGGAVDDTITTGITLEAWIKPASQQNGGIISNDYTLGNKKGYDFFLWASGTYGRLYIDFGNGTACGRTYWNIPDAGWYGQWHHVAATWDGSTIKLYVDGVQQSTVSHSGSYSDPGKATLIGGINYGTLPYCSFNGEIDEVRIWDTATPTFNLEATPDEDINPIDTDHTVTATVTIDKVSDGTEPAPGVLVDFAVTGMNADTDSDYTDSSGQVTFTYTGAGGAGMDTITAEIDQDCYQYGSVDVTKYWVDRFVSGGGQILEMEGAKRKDWLVISFGGAVGDAGTSGLVGEWEVNFHNVNAEGFDRTKFHTTSIVAMNFYEQLCGIAMNFTAMGEWQGIPGYKMIFRAQDAGEPGSLDNVRIELFNPGGAKVYDTHWGSEFTDESDCVGGARTGLDHGNLQMDDLS